MSARLRIIQTQSDAQISPDNMPGLRKRPLRNLANRKARELIDGFAREFQIKFDRMRRVNEFIAMGSQLQSECREFFKIKRGHG